MRGHKLSWAPGEVTMVVGFAAITLIGYNGIIDRPAPDDGTEFGIGLELRVLAGAAGRDGDRRHRLSPLAGERKRQERKAPGTV